MRMPASGAIWKQQGKITSLGTLKSMKLNNHPPGTKIWAVVMFDPKAYMPELIQQYTSKGQCYTHIRRASNSPRFRMYQFFIRHIDELELYQFVSFCGRQKQTGSRPKQTGETVSIWFDTFKNPRWLIMTTHSLTDDQLKKVYRKSLRKKNKESWACADFERRQCLEKLRCWIRTKAARKRYESWGMRRISIQYMRDMAKTCCIYKRIQNGGQALVYDRIVPDPIKLAGDFSPMDDWLMLSILYNYLIQLNTPDPGGRRWAYQKSSRH